MSWYSKYLQVYGKDPSEVDAGIKTEIRQSLDRKRTAEAPLASVVLIAHNEAERILSCLWSLADNECSFPIEILVVDNNSTDSTGSVLEELGVTTFLETKKSPGYARQCGLDHARGKYHVCIDADTIYPVYHIETLVGQLRRSGVVAAYGLWSFLPGEGMSRGRLFVYELLRDCYLKIQNIKRPELVVRGMVFAFDTELGRKYGFRTDIIRGEDGSLALNLKNDGRIVLCTSRRCRPVTSNAIFKKQGSLSGALVQRLRRAVAFVPQLFFKKKEYQDTPENMVGGH